MKKQFFKTTSIRVYSTALLTSVLLMTGFNPAKATGKSAKSNKAEVTFLGSSNSLMTFNVNYENLAEKTFTLELTNDEGEILYQQEFNDKAFNKNIYVKNAGEKCKINFKIRAGKNLIKQAFEINPQTRVVEEFVVTRL